MLCRNHDRYASARCPINWYLVQPSSSTSTKEATIKDDIIEDITEESEVEETDVNTSFHFSQEDTTTE